MIQKYLEKTFTEEGHKKLFNYLRELIKLNYEIKKYPFNRKGKVLGLPDNEWFKYYKSKDELVGQIKMLMNILGFVKVEVTLNNKEKILFSFKQGGKNDFT